MTAVLILPLALGLALPEMRWCRLAWAELAECLAACPRPVACSANATACEASGWDGAVLPCGVQVPPRVTPSCDGPSSCGTAAGFADECSAESVAPESETDDAALPQGRAWCPSAPRSGTLPHAPDVDAPLEALASAIPVSPTVEPGPNVWRGHAAEAVAIPPDCSPHAPPPIRAPPVC